MDEQVVSLIIIVLVLMNVLQMFWGQKSIPVEQVHNLLNKGEKLADTTDTPFDNYGIEFARHLLSLIQSDEAVISEGVVSEEPITES